MRTLTEQEEQGRRLRDARLSKFSSATDFWRSIKRSVKVSQQTYLQHENGTRGFTANAWEYAKALGVSPAWLVWGIDSGRDVPSVEFKIAGKVAAGSQGFFEPAYADGDGEPVFFYPQEISLALEVEGDSMLPRYHDGDVIFFGDKYEDPMRFVGREVMAQLRDGRKLLKVLARGSQPGLWTLYSVNTSYDPISDVELDWILPVKWVKIAT